VPAGPPPLAQAKVLTASLADYPPLAKETATSPPRGESSDGHDNQRHDNERSSGGRGAVNAKALHPNATLIDSSALPIIQQPSTDTATASQSISQQKRFDNLVLETFRAAGVHPEQKQQTRQLAESNATAALLIQSSLMLLVSKGGTANGTLSCVRATAEGSHRDYPLRLQSHLNTSDSILDNTRDGRIGGEDEEKDVGENVEGRQSHPDRESGAEPSSAVPSE